MKPTLFAASRWKPPEMSVRLVLDSLGCLPICGGVC